jgi:hypothetical protein
MAAGQGFKTFTTGEVLTAGDVNGYLMQGVLVFASAAARNAAITSPQEGQFAFTKDDNTLTYYDGAAWVVSGATGDVTGVTAGTGITVTDPSGPVPTVTNAMATAIDAKADLIAGTGADTFSRLAVGTNGQVLTADSTVSPTGLKWATPSASSPTYAGCSVYNSTTFSLANNTMTRITMNSEFFDTNGFHSTSTDTARITIPTGYGGYYLVSVAGKWETSSTGYRAVEIYKNNASLLSMIQIPGNSAINAYDRASIIISLSAGDFIELYAYQNAGSALSGYFREYEYPLQIEWLGA